jgi:hypothetical protein
MELLLREKPRRNVGVRTDRQYQTIVSYLDEASEAQKKGYSWNQICQAIRDELTQKGEWNETWDFWDAMKIISAKRREQSVKN